VQAMLWRGVELNMVLIAFNLIPIPPLDGSHVVKYLLPTRAAVQYQRFGRFGILALILILWLAPGVLNDWLTPALSGGYAMLGHVQTFVLPSTIRWLQ
jgi:Zn-dependent protease